MSTKTWILFVCLCVALLGGLVWLSRGSNANVSDVDTRSVIAANQDNGNIADHVLGDPDGVVTIIEYGDYQCPGCGSAASVLGGVTESYKDKGVRMIFRNNPLSIHAGARMAASAAEAAGLQGKFWEMHDLLYQNQNNWNTLSSEQRQQTFYDYGDQLGLNMETFKADMGSDNVRAKIDYDLALGRKDGVSGTPTIYVGDDKISDWQLKDGAVTTSGSDSDPYVWASADDLTTYVIKPALEKAGKYVD